MIKIRKSPLKNSCLITDLKIFVRCPKNVLVNDNALHSVVMSL